MIHHSDLFSRLQQPPYKEVHILHLIIDCLQPWYNVLRENLCKHFPWRHWGQTTQLPPAETRGVYENSSVKSTEMRVLKPGVRCQAMISASLDVETNLNIRKIKMNCCRLGVMNTRSRPNFSPSCWKRWSVNSADMSASIACIQILLKKIGPFRHSD